MDNTNKDVHRGDIVKADNENTKLQIGQTDINNLSPITHAEELTQYFKLIAANKKGGITNVNEGFALLQRTKELGIPFLAGVEHIHVVNGKTGIDIHLIRALLSKAGTITWTKVKDYVPLYEYTDGNIGYISGIPDHCVIVANRKAAENVSEGKTGIWIASQYKFYDKDKTIPEYLLTDGHVICNTPSEYTTAKAEGKLPVYRVQPEPIDYVIEYKFERTRLINGTEKVQIAYGRFTYIDAQTAGLLEKDTYKLYMKQMISTRAFTLGAREIASDLLHGCYETNELFEITRQPHKMKAVSPEDDIEDAVYID